MKRFSKTIPSISIKKTDREPFPVVCEEVRGWFAVPKIGENTSFATFATNTGERILRVEISADKNALVHNTMGTELVATVHRGNGVIQENRIIAQLTDSCCKFLAFFDRDGDANRYTTFKDRIIEQLNTDNFESETLIRQDDSIIIDENGNYCIDFSAKRRSPVGRYEVTVNDKTFDTVRVVTANTHDSRIIIEQYFDCNGRTIIQCDYNTDSMLTENGEFIGMKSEYYPFIIVNHSPYVCTAITVTENAI